MKIGAKLISLLTLLFVAVTGLEIVIQQRVLMPSFAELERDDAKTSMKRIDYALNMTLDTLELSAVDWGNWADVYNFVASPTPGFVSANITAVAMKQLQVDALLIIDRDGKRVAATARDFTSGTPLPLDLSMAARLPENFPWRRDVADRPVRGFIRTNLGIMMLASAPILDGSGGGSSRGMVIMGRLLTPGQLARIGAQAQAALALVGTGSADAAEWLEETAGETQVYRSFKDIYGKPLMTLRVEVPRKITQQGRGVVSYVTCYTAGAFATGLLLLALMLNRIVLGPLAKVTRHAVAIGEGADLTSRLNMPGRDEVAMLAREFDHMVAHVSESRRRSVDQSFQAGFAELAKGVLHNLGNAMTPLGVRLSKLSEGLRDAPVADLELAAAERDAEPSESERRADLDEFLRLGCRQLCTAVGEAAADVAVIQRQVSIVQSALAELMGSARNQHVVESVRLPDLVAQTMEIVPDSCRQRLVVETDDSLRRIGVVQVARTVLRLVLQNLIINAADAVRDAGRETGKFRVAAQIVRDAGREQLHLRCDDDGIGIAKEDLERVFEHGFSTKGRDTNHGIGLHWSANAVAALGGRLWAASDGLGLGASLHLIVPL